MIEKRTNYYTEETNGFGYLICERSILTGLNFCPSVVETKKENVAVFLPGTKLERITKMAEIHQRIEAGEKINDIFLPPLKKERSGDNTPTNTMNLIETIGKGHKGVSEKVSEK